MINISTNTGTESDLEINGMVIYAYVFMYVFSNRKVTLIFNHQRYFPNFIYHIVTPV